MQGYISSWKEGDDSITSCPEGDVFCFTLEGVKDAELSQWLQQTGPFEDSGPCPGNVRVRFLVQGGCAVDITRLQAQVSWQEF